MVEWSISLQPQEELAAFARFGNAVASLCVEKKGARACLKKAFRELRVPVRGRFYPNKGGVAGYGNRMRVKYTAKWGLQIAEMIFQTRSSSLPLSIPIFLHFILP